MRRVSSIGTECAINIPKYVQVLQYDIGRGHHDQQNRPYQIAWYGNRGVSGMVTSSQIVEKLSESETICY